jgi:hypothetical protein
MPVAGSIVQAMTQSLGPQVLATLNGTSGAGDRQAEAVVRAAVPALLSGLLGRLRTPEGRPVVGAVLGRSEPDGIDLLGRLFGNPDASALTHALRVFSGLSHRDTRALLGVIVAGVLAAVARVQTEQGLDLDGLAGWLGNQQHAIAEAMPAGFLGLLRGTRLLTGLAGAPHGPAVPAVVFTDTKPGWLAAMLGVVRIGSDGYGLFRERRSPDRA